VLVKFVRSVGPIYTWRGVGVIYIVVVHVGGWDYVSVLRSPTVHSSDGYMCTKPWWNDINKEKQNNSEKMRKQELVSLIAANKPIKKNLPSRLHAGLFRSYYPLPSTVYVWPKSYWIRMGQSENTNTSQHNGWIVIAVPHGSNEKSNGVCYKRRLGRLR
jgi:hypothetical protein